MNPHKMNKIDVSSMSEQDQKAFKMYGKLPAKNVLTKMQKDRKYFDSGDYAMQKAGVPTAQAPGTAIPTAERVPHASPPTPGGLGSSPTGTTPVASPGLTEDKPLNPIHNVGVGISPQATSEAMDMPKGGHHHARRSSESHGVRISPPGTMREAGSTPSSSFPIQHGGFGSSPVKSSNLGRQVDEEIEG